MTNNAEFTFSRHNREKMLYSMAQEELDLLVIGGGITGCGIALDAVLRGLKVGLVEMQDFAEGTSSRSTKLIHGGLRYLKQGEIGLVREVGRERAILHKNAPHLVIPEPMLLPLVQGGTYGKLATSFGLLIYDWLAGVKRYERRKMLSKQATLTREPLLREEGLKGSGLYVEYRTDDSRLTIEVIKKAVTLGALAVNYAEVSEFEYDKQNITGAVVHDTLNDKRHIISAKKIVNATGPWVDLLRKKDNSLKGKRLHLTKGVHIVVDGDRFPLKQAVYFDVEDGRMIFAIPRDGKTYIGTTDTNYEGNMEDPEIKQADIAYLVKAANAMFPSIKLTENEVESYWVGLRPLIHEDGKSPSELSRKDEIFISDSGLITIAGGKLTGYRKMAERVVDLVIKKLENEEDRTYLPCSTASQPLSGGNIGGVSEMWPLYLKEKANELFKQGLEKERALKLVHRYGSNIGKVMSYYKQAENEANKYKLDTLTLMELMYCVEHEMVVAADDFLVRRTGIAFFEAGRYKKCYNAVQKYMEKYHAMV